jgi:hypothetical protein
MAMNCQCGCGLIFTLHCPNDDESLAKLLEPPGGDKWDERWLQIPTFLRRPELYQPKSNRHTPGAKR